MAVQFYNSNMSRMRESILKWNEVWFGAIDIIKLNIYQEIKIKVKSRALKIIYAKIQANTQFKILELN